VPTPDEPKRPHAVNSTTLTAKANIALIRFTIFLLYLTINDNLLAQFANKFLMFVAMTILVAKFTPQETWLYLTINDNLLAQFANKFLMFVAMTILVAKFTPQETWRLS
jgi:branched-subunit amino acid transport protein